MVSQRVILVSGCYYDAVAGVVCARQPSLTQLVQTRPRPINEVTCGAKMARERGKVFPYVCIGSHAFAMFSAHALREGRGHACT